MKQQYTAYIEEQNIEGSNKASSYIRALDLLDGILKKTKLLGHADFWSIESITEIDSLYEYALEFQKKDDSEFLKSDLPPSYGRNGYYSAALRSFKEFLIIAKHESQLWHLYNNPKISPMELSEKIIAEKIDSIEKMADLEGLDFSDKEGKEILRQVKMRINQQFFRKMILTTYETRCCISGLNIPEVLRASHIVAWKDDKENRMNPSNGLCLSATYDAAFDRYLISFDENYRMILSSALKEYYSNEAFKTQFLAIAGQKISFPKRFLPDQQFLEQHRTKLLT